MASLQILVHFTSCYHTCNTNDPSFVIGSCQVRCLVLIFNHSVTTYSALDGTHVGGAALERSIDREETPWSKEEKIVMICSFVNFQFCLIFFQILFSFDPAPEKEKCCLKSLCNKFQNLKQGPSLTTA